MKKSTQNIRITVIALILLALGGVTVAMGQEGSSDSGGESRAIRAELAKMSWGWDRITFFPRLSGEVRVAVTGPDFYWRQVSDGTMVFRVWDVTGDPLPDGSYGYEVLEIVTNKEIEALEEEGDRSAQMAMKRQWRREGRWPPPSPRVQNGSFRIVNGRIMPE